MIKLSKEQQKVINIFMAFLKSKDLTFSLTGSAGTGKSFTVSELIKRLKLEYVLCAPTHKAALVLRKYCKEPAITLHSLLALSPLVAIENFNLSDLRFRASQEKWLMPAHGLIICDEASMINDELFDMLVNECRKLNSKILFVSDPCQLMPVNNKTYSKVYSECDQSFQLTEIHRQEDSSCLMPLLARLRTETIDTLHPAVSEESILSVYSSRQEFINKAADYYKKAIENQDILACKMLAYTNRNVSLYNQCIHKAIWQDDAPYHVGDIITAYDNGQTGQAINGYANGIASNKDKFKFFNSMDYVICDIKDTYRKLMHGIGTKGWLLTLYDTYNNSYGQIYMLDTDNDFEKIAAELEKLRIYGLRHKDWKSYTSFKSSFCTPVTLTVSERSIMRKTFDLGYCCTVHKSQGSSYDNVFVDWRNIQRCCDEEERRQLEYVALSRTRKNAFIFN